MLFAVVAFATARPGSAEGSVVSEVTVRGSVRSFDRSVVQVAQESGTVLLIPRRLVPESFDLRPGRPLELTLPLEDFEKLKTAPDAGSAR